MPARFGVVWLQTLDGVGDGFPTAALFAVWAIGSSAFLLPILLATTTAVSFGLLAGAAQRLVPQRA